MRKLAIPSLLSAIAAGVPGIAAAKISVVQPVQMIASNCKLEGWQYALEPNAQDLVRVELSPTLSTAQVTCVYQVLTDYNLPLDRPAPVEVKQTLIRKSNGTPQ